MHDKHAKGSITHFGAGTSFEGTIDVPHDLFIYGDFSGTICCSGTLSIGSKALIKATVSAKSALIGGRVEGDLTCTGSVELEESSVLIGNITARELIIHKGARFQGTSSPAESIE